MKVRPLLNLKLPVLLLLLFWCSMTFCQNRTIIGGLEEVNPKVYKTRIVIKSNKILQPVNDEGDKLSFTNRFQNDSFRSRYSTRNAISTISFASLEKDEHEKLIVEMDAGLAKNDCELISNFQLDLDTINKENTDYTEVYWMAKEAFWSPSEIKNHSASNLQFATKSDLAFYVFFEGISAEDLPVYHVLSKIISQRNSTYTKNLVTSGLSLNSSFNFHPIRAKEFLFFEIAPNPFGLKEAIEGFFAELYAMPLFDYTSKSQLDLAKEQIAIDFEFANDRFATKADLTLGLIANEFEFGQKAYLDSVSAVTKVDIMNFIRRYLHHKPFLLHVEAPIKMKQDVEKYLYNSKPIEDYIISFSSKKDHKLDEEDLPELQEVAYILNLTSWAEVDIVLYGSARKKHKQKRADAIKAYMKTKGVRNTFNLVYKGSFSKENTDVITFKMSQNED